MATTSTSSAWASVPSSQRSQLSSHSTSSSNMQFTSRGHMSSFSKSLSLIRLTRRRSNHILNRIIRILFMVPIYACVSFLSYYYYKHAIYFEVLRDTYEAFAIASFFSLLCHYLAPTLHEQKDYFRKLTPHPWPWPVTWMTPCFGGERGCLRTPKSGLTWFNVRNVLL
jgi:hypothetical protein